MFYVLAFINGFRLDGLEEVNDYTSIMNPLS
jgi:hypothetical protein